MKEKKQILGEKWGIMNSGNNMTVRFESKTEWKQEWFSKWIKVLLVGLFAALYLFHCFYNFLFLSLSCCFVSLFFMPPSGVSKKTQKKEKEKRKLSQQPNIHEVDIHIFFEINHFFMLSQCTDGTWLLDNLQAFT